DNYSLGLGTGEHIDRFAEFTVLNKPEKKPDPEVKIIDYKPLEEKDPDAEVPETNHTSITDEFRGKGDYRKLDFPKQEPYVPPYIAEIHLQNKTGQPPQMGDIIDMNNFLNMTTLQG